MRGRIRPRSSRGRNPCWVSSVTISHSGPVASSSHAWCAVAPSAAPVQASRRKGPNSVISVVTGAPKVTQEKRLPGPSSGHGPAVSVIKAWAYEHIEELEVARDRYDQAAATRTPAGQAVR